MFFCSRTLNLHALLGRVHFRKLTFERSHKTFLQNHIIEKYYIKNSSKQLSITFSKGANFLKFRHAHMKAKVKVLKTFDITYCLQKCV